MIKIIKKIKLLSKGKEVSFDININPERLFIAKPQQVSKHTSWEALTEEALNNPLGVKKLEETELVDKKVCIITDDWGRPTPASRIVPRIIKRLELTGIKDENIVFVTASGMHNPMSEADLKRKLGEEVYKRFRCVSHDAGDKSRLAFVGITEFGTPVWVNKYVAEADVKIGVGRVYPHISYGYEGGYKLIDPGVSSFETIVRSHSLSLSKYSVYGNVKGNPSRGESYAVGKMVGIDFLIDFVVDSKNEPSDPVDCFAGKVEEVFEECVKVGERKVWGTKVGKQYSITIMSTGDIVDHGIKEKDIEDNPTYYLGLALKVTKESGTVIALMDEEVSNSRNIIEGLNLDELSLSDLLLLHEKRNWNCNEREVQNYIKRLRDVFYSRRIMELHKQNLFIVSDSFSKNKLTRYNAQYFTDINTAVKKAMALYEDPDVLVIPGGEKEGEQAFPIPIIDYSF